VTERPGDVSPPTAEDSSRIDRIERLAQLAPEQAFDELKDLELLLGDVENRVLPESGGWDGADLEHDGFLRIDGMLTPLLGPEANQKEGLLRSRYANHNARHHLIEVANLLD
jgi:hypothetical protein